MYRSKGANGSLYTVYSTVLYYKRKEKSQSALWTRAPRLKGQKAMDTHTASLLVIIGGRSRLYKRKVLDCTVVVAPPFYKFPWFHYGRQTTTKKPSLPPPTTTAMKESES